MFPIAIIGIIIKVEVVSNFPKCPKISSGVTKNEMIFFSIDWIVINTFINL